MYIQAEIIKPIAISIANKFGGGELEITKEGLENVSFVWYEAKKPPYWVAKIIKVPEYITCLGVKPLIMICFKPYFDSVDENVQKAIIFHELMHITYDEKGNFKLTPHTIQDFKSLVGKIGLNYEKASDMFGDLKIEEKV